MDFYIIAILLFLLFGVSHIVSTAVSTTISSDRLSKQYVSSSISTNVLSSSSLFSSYTVLQRVGIIRGGVQQQQKTKQRRSSFGKVSTNKNNNDIKTTTKGPLQIFIETIKNGRRHLVAAAIARTASIFIMYPVDAIKTRLQLKQINPFRITGLFNGVGGSLLGQVPYGVLAFGSYEMYKSLLLQQYPIVQPLFIYAIAAILGDLTGSGWICPSEVVKQQVQAGIFPTTSVAITSIYKQKGIQGFYQGYFSSISRDVPFRVAQLTTFEITKNIILRIKRNKITSISNSKSSSESKSKSTSALKASTIELTPIEAAVCGAISGSFSAAITSPLDRIKTLLMTTTNTNNQLYGTSVFSCAKKIWLDEGIVGITTGMIPRVIYIAPSVVIFFVIYEISQQKLKKVFIKDPVSTTQKQNKQ